MIETEWNVSLKDKELGLVLILMMVTKIQDLKLSLALQEEWSKNIVRLC